MTNIQDLEQEFQTMMVEKELNPQYDQAHQKATQKITESNDITGEKQTKIFQKMAEVKPGEAYTLLEQELDKEL